MLGGMQETLPKPTALQAQQNPIKDHPYRRLVIFLAVLIGISIAIAAHSKKEPARFVAMA